jgi:hypothetical protein
MSCRFSAGLCALAKAACEVAGDSGHSGTPAGLRFRRLSRNCSPARQLLRVYDYRCSWPSRGFTAAPEASWQDELDAAVTAANPLEAAQLTAVREPPARSVDLLRRGQPELPALRAALERYVAILEPYQHAKLG